VLMKRHRGRGRVAASPRGRLDSVSEINRVNLYRGTKSLRSYKGYGPDASSGDTNYVPSKYKTCSATKAKLQW